MIYANPTKIMEMVMANETITYIFFCYSSWNASNIKFHKGDTLIVI